MKNPFLIGQKVYLRPLEREDAPRVTPWFNLPDVRRTLLRHRPINLRSEEEFIDKAYQGEHDVMLGIELRSVEQLVGVTGLHAIDFKDRHAGFGIVVGEPEQWGKGYGTEATALIVGYAFDTLNLNRVWLHVYEDNERGIRAYRKVGFREEGRLRQHAYHDGRYWDTVTMGILREEWDAAAAVRRSAP